MQRCVVVSILGVDLRLILEKKACYRKLSSARGVMQRRPPFIILGIDQIRTVFDDVFEPLNFFGLFVQRCFCHDLLQAFLKICGGNTGGGQVLRAELDQRVLIGELASDTLILQNGLVGLALFAITFTQTKDGGGSDLPLVVVLVDDRLIGLNGGVEVVIGLFFEQSL